MRQMCYNASKKIVILFMLLCAVPVVRAQSGTDLRINELLVVNDSNYIDGFGQRSPWVELFNTAYNTVDVGGMYLTNDMAHPTKYRIPKGQSSTIIPSRGFLVFFADNNPTHGVLHLNFDLRESTMIALFESNGKTLVDSVYLPQIHKSDISWGRSVNGTGGWSWFERTTPNASNEPDVLVTAADRFGMVDPSGSGMAFISMGVVFSALILLSIVFTMLGKLMSGAFFKKKSTSEQDASAKLGDVELSGEVAAAIMMALHLYKKEQDDQNHAVLTINRMSKVYSPWSSKIYSMRRMPR